MAIKDQLIFKDVKLIGLAFTIPAVLVCGPLLGYGIAIVLMRKGAPSFLLPLFIGMGVILAFVQIYRALKILLEADKDYDRKHAK